MFISHFGLRHQSTRKKPGDMSGDTVTGGGHSAAGSHGIDLEVFFFFFF